MQDPSTHSDDDAVDQVVRQGPAGTWAVVGVATFIVVLLWFLFYFLAYLPRGVME